MGQHSQNSAKPSHSYKLFGIISKVTSLAEIYKAFSRKLHPADRSNKQRTSHRHQSNFISHDDSNPSIVRSQRQRDGEITPDREEKKRERSKEERDKPEEFVISSPKLLSRTTSRVAPTLSKSSSGGWPNFIDLYVHVKRSASVSSATSPMAFLSKTMSQRNINMAAAWRKPPPLEKKLECTLEELCFGCTKEVRITREINSNAGLIFQEEEYVTIKVKPGWRRGTKITFESKGDERGGTLPEDIIFLIEEKKHPLFKREGDDLELGVEVPLVQALTGCIVEVPTLGGKDMVTLNMEDEIIYPGFEKTVLGQGMPKYKDGQEGDHQRGDLRVRFRVVFPEMLSEEQRSQVLSILKDG